MPSIAVFSNSSLMDKYNTCKAREQVQSVSVKREMGHLRVKSYGWMVLVLRLKTACLKEIAFLHRPTKVLFHRRMFLRSDIIQIVISNLNNRHDTPPHLFICYIYLPTSSKLVHLVNAIGICRVYPRVRQMHTDRGMKYIQL